MKRRNIFLLVIVVLVAGTYVGYKYLYKEHRDIQSEAPSLTLESAVLFNLFQTEQADQALNKTLVVTGFIKEIESTSITLEGGVRCIFEVLPKGQTLGQKIDIKGRCIGYNDLFEIVELDQCQITDRP
jgi:hypothetical protein